MMKNILRKIAGVCVLIFLLATLSFAAFASQSQETAALSDAEAATQETLTDSQSEDDVTGTKALAAGITIAVVAGAGAIGMALTIMKSVDGIARQPEAGDSIRTSMMLGLVFLETAIIYALIVAILIVFVL